MTIREAGAADAAECGRILYAAFAGIANQHNFPPDFPSVAVATDAASMLIAHPGFHGLVAEEDGLILGSNFMDQRSQIGGIGPISVDPAAQNRRVGRTLMQAAPERMLWASDWPHTNAIPGKPLTEVTPFSKIDDTAVLKLFTSWCPDEKTRKTILVDTPAKLYRFA